MSFVMSISCPPRSDTLRQGAATRIFVAAARVRQSDSAGSWHVARIASPACRSAWQSGRLTPKTASRMPQVIAAIRECAKKYADDVRPLAFVSRV
jgi:hypothetical protein